MTEPATVSIKEHDRVAREFEKVRAPALRLADAAKRLDRAIEQLEWALWATDPNEEHGNFNDEYANRRYQQALPEYEEALGDVRTLIETEWS